MDLATRLYSEHRDFLCTVAAKHGGHDDAADVVQDVFCGLLRKGAFARLEGLPPEHQKNWLAQCVRNQVNNLHSYRTCQRRDASLACSVEAVGDMPSAGIDPAAALDVVWALKKIDAVLIGMRQRSRSSDWPVIESILRGEHVGDRLTRRLRTHLCWARKELRRLCL